MTSWLTFCAFQPVVYPDSISVYHKLRLSPASSPPPTSLILDCIILSHKQRRVAAKTEEDIAIYDYRIAKKAEMPKFMQDVLSEIWRLQQEEMVRARSQVWELIKAVEELERETWNRPDAVEDVGSAAGKA